MLRRLVVKKLFRAILSCVALAGMMSYGIHLRGGDPSGLWASVADQGGVQLRSLVAGVRNDAAAAVDTLTRRIDAGGMADEAGKHADRSTRVFSWRDAEGVTHFSSEQPAGIDAESMSVDPDVNILAPVRAPASQAPAPQTGGSRELIDQLSSRLRGVADHGHFARAVSRTPCSRSARISRSSAKKGSVRWVSRR